MKKLTAVSSLFSILTGVMLTSCASDEPDHASGNGDAASSHADDDDPHHRLLSGDLDSF